MNSLEPDRISQEVSATGGFAYGVIGADIHVFGDGSPVYLLFEHRDPPRPDARWLRQQPSRMLDARTELVEFTGRDAELAELLAWRDADTPRLAARWLHGEGGQGKTRLAGQLARDAQQVGWRVVDAVHGTDTHPPAAGSQDLRLGEGTAGVLVLVDYADRWPLTDLSWLMSNSLMAQPEPINVRVLLIGRSVSSWRGLRAKLDRLRRGFDLSDQLLSPLPSNGRARDRMYSTARECFARHYPEAAASSAITPPPPLANTDFGLTLTIHMAALVAVDAAARGRTPPTDMVGLSAYLLDREYENWRQLYENADRGLDYRTPDTEMARTVFTAVLTGSADRGSAERILARLIPQMDIDSALADHAVCYPPADPAMALEPMIPDRLAEDFLALMVPGHPVTGFPADSWATGIADTLLTTKETADRAPRALTFLASATDRWPHLGTNVLYPLLSVHPGVAVGGGSVALTAIASIGAHDDEISPGLLSVLHAIGPLLPTGSHADLDVGILAVVERLTPQELAETADVARQAGLYTWLGICRSNAGEWATALTAHAEAVRLYRQMPCDDEHHRSDLATTLDNLATALGQQGRFSEAIAQAREAVKIRRDVAENNPSGRDFLARSLKTLSARLSEGGRVDEALPVSEEAVRIGRELAEADPDRYGHALTGTLSDLVVLLYALHRDADAVDAGEEAVQWGRRLATASPDRHLEWLGTSLNNLAAALSGQGLADRAAATQVEAVNVYRRLAAANPRAHQPTLLGALANLSRTLAKLDRTEEALAAAEEAVHFARQMAEGGAVLDQRRLAVSLEALGNILSRLDRIDEALDAYGEAVQTHLDAANIIGSSDPGLGRLTDRLATLYRQTGDRKNEAGTLINFGTFASSSTQQSQLVAAARRAATLFHELDDPKGEAAALAQLSTLLAGTELDDEAITAGQRAAEIYHQNGDRRLEATALNNLGSVLLRTRRYGDAITTSQRAIAIEEELGAAPNQHSRGQPFFNLGSALLAANRPAEAIIALEQAASVYQRTGKGEYETSGRPGLEADSYSQLGRAYTEIGRHGDAARAHQRAAELFEAAGHHQREQRDELVAASATLVQAGQYAEAVAVGQRALASSRTARDRRNEAWALAQLGAGLLRLGRFDDSVDHSRRAASIFSELALPDDDGLGEAMALTNLVSVLEHLNRTEECIDPYQRAAAKWRTVGDTEHEHWTVRKLGTALINLRRPAEAIEPLQRWAELSRASEDRFGEAEALVSAAVALVAVAQFEEALAAGQRAGDFFSESGDRTGEGFALSSIRLALRGLGRYDEAAEVERQIAELARRTRGEP